MQITGSANYTIYENGVFSIKRFKSQDPVIMPDGRYVNSLTIKGNHIPNDIDIVISGEFEVYNRGLVKDFTFCVSNFEEARNRDKESIIKWLKSLKGVGPTTAKLIYMKFGNDTYDILDSDIQNLKKVKGIGKKKFKVIAADYLARGSQKELFTYLDKVGVSDSKINKIFDRYKDQSLDNVKKHPYVFYMRNYFSFDVAERISKTEKLDTLSDERIKGCILESLTQNEKTGSTYLEWKDLLHDALKLLNVENSIEIKKKVAILIRKNSKEMISTKIMTEKDKEMTLLQKIYTNRAEKNIASNVKKILAEDIHNTVNYIADIDEAEDNLGINLSDEQRKAVLTALSSPFTIITGGPGTGKTAFQKVLLYVYKKNFKDPITMGAPTGRAARRMTESSGEPARTIHQILCLVADEDFEEAIPETIESGLVVIDEMSMIDIFLAEKLFSAIQPGCRIVCIGDVNQLPSVGPGTVLKELIESGLIPVIRFTKVFRQAEGSSIATNAAKINKGDTDLDIAEDFVMIEKNNSIDIADEVCKQFKKALGKYHIDDITVLTPYRKNTATGVNELNIKLREMYNPVASGSKKVSGLDIYVGDKVMFCKNTVTDENVVLSNGDIGYGATRF